MAPDVELANIITNEPLARYIDIDEKPLASSSENSSSHVRFTPEDSELGETSATRSLLEFTPVDEDEVVLTEKEWMRDNEQEDAPLESPYLASQRRRRRRRRSSQTHRFFFTFTAEEERVVVKKLDRRIVFFVSLLYMLSFLDRSSRWKSACCDRN